MMLLFTLFTLLSAPDVLLPDHPLEITISTNKYEVVSSVDKPETVYLTEYRILNDTEEPYYTWVHFDKPQHGKKSIMWHFWGAYKVGHPVYDGVALYEVLNDIPPREPIVGYSFMAKVEPGESFKYIVCGRDGTDPHLERYIETAPVDWLFEVLKFSIPNSILYQSDHLVIDADVIAGFETLTVESP